MERSGLAADVCGSELTVAWDGHNVEMATFAMDETSVSFDPQNVTVKNGQWYTVNSSINVNAVVAFADEARFIIDGTPSSYVPFDGTVAVSGLANGENLLGLQLWNQCGIESAVYERTVILDNTAPNAASLLVQNGQDYTNSLSVYISTEVDADVMEMQVACDGSFDNEPWLAYSNTYVRLLLPEMVRSGSWPSSAMAPAMSPTNCRMISLDTVAPTAPVLANNSMIVNSSTLGHHPGPASN